MSPHCPSPARPARQPVPFVNAIDSAMLAVPMVMGLGRLVEHCLGRVESWRSVVATRQLARSSCRQDSPPMVIAHNGCSNLVQVRLCSRRRVRGAWGRRVRRPVERSRSSVVSRRARLFRPERSRSPLPDEGYLDRANSASLWPPLGQARTRPCQFCSLPLVRWLQV